MRNLWCHCSKQKSKMASTALRYTLKSLKYTVYLIHPLGWQMASEKPSLCIDLGRRAFIACRGLQISMKNWDKWSMSFRPLGTNCGLAASKALLALLTAIPQAPKAIHLRSWGKVHHFAKHLFVTYHSRAAKSPGPLRTKPVRLLAARR